MRDNGGESPASELGGLQSRLHLYPTHYIQGDFLVAIFRRLTSKGTSGKHHSSSRGYLKRRTRFAPVCDWLEVRALLSNIVVTNNDDSGPGSLRQAIASLAERGDHLVCEQIER